MAKTAKAAIFNASTPHGFPMPQPADAFPLGGKPKIEPNRTAR